MPGNPNPRGGVSTKVSDAKEIFSPQDDLRPANFSLTAISEDEADYCLIHCTIPAGVVVPMHSHADRETFYVISGNMEALRVDRWEKLGPGDVFDVRDGTRHAWRNSSQAPAAMLCVTTTKLARFLQEISVSHDDISTPDEQARRFRRLVRENGYWLASPEENAAVGLTVNWDGSGD